MPQAAVNWLIQINTGFPGKFNLLNECSTIWAERTFFRGVNHVFKDSRSH